MFAEDGMKLLCYVDNLLVIENTDKDVSKWQDQLRKDLILEALDKPESFLAIELSWHKDAAYLSQKLLTNELLENTNMAESEPLKTVMTNKQDCINEDHLR